MSPIEEALQRVVSATPLGWTPEDIARAARVSVDLAALSARKAAGEDVETELAIAKATALNIAAGAQLSAGTAIRDALIEVTTKILTGVLLGAAA